MLLSAEVLQPRASSTTLRMIDDSLLVQDGPYADTKDRGLPAAFGPWQTVWTRHRRFSGAGT